MINATDATFEREVLDAELPVLVDFTAPWCKPCRAIEPFLEELGRENEGRLALVRLDIDANLGIPSRYGVLSLPTVMLFVAGEPVETITAPSHEGAMPRRRAGVGSVLTDDAAWTRPSDADEGLPGHAGRACRTHRAASRGPAPEVARPSAPADTRPVRHQAETGGGRARRHVVPSTGTASGSRSRLPCPC